MYSRRNPRRASTIFICALLALSSLVFLSMLRYGLEQNKLQYIEVYRKVTVLRPISTDATVSELWIPVNERHLAAKLAFGQASLPLLEVSQEHVSTLLKMLGITDNVPKDTAFIIHKDALAAVNAAQGLSQPLAALPRFEIVNGPRVAILTAQASPQSAYLTTTSLDSDGLGFAIKNYGDEKIKLEKEGAFIRGMVLTILLTALIVQTLVTAATILSSLRSRHNEIAVLRVVGFEPGAVRNYVLGDLLVLILLGAACGVACGWAIGFALLHSVTPGGLAPFWPNQTLGYATVYLCLLFSIAGVSVARVTQSSDPVLTIERAEEAQ